MKNSAASAQPGAQAEWGVRVSSIVRAKSRRNATIILKNGFFFVWLARPVCAKEVFAMLQVTIAENQKVMITNNFKTWKTLVAGKIQWARLLSANDLGHDHDHCPFIPSVQRFGRCLTTTKHLTLSSD